MQVICIFTVNPEVDGIVYNHIRAQALNKLKEEVHIP